MRTQGINKQFKHILFPLPFNCFTIAVGKLCLTPLSKLLITPRTLLHHKIEINGYNQHKLKLDIYTPKAIEKGQPVLLYIHGGGFAYPAVSYHYKLAMTFAEKAKCTVIFPNYHLLPNYPFPAAFEDICRTYDWIITNAKKHNFDLNKIAVAGDSAGGTLTANLCNLYAYKKKYTPCFQMLLYPATDYTMHTNSMKEFTDTPLWNAKNTIKVWDLYLKNCTTEMKDLASPLQNTLPDTLPDSYLESADIDCLRDEGLLYAQKLIDHGTQVELHKTKGTPHGFDLARHSEITQHYINLRINALKKAFTK